MNNPCRHEKRRHGLEIAGGILALFLAGRAAGGEEQAPGSTVGLEISASRAQRGALVDLDVTLITRERVRSLSLAIDFEEESLQVLEVRRGESLDPAASFDVRSASIDNRNDIPGNQVREGWIFLELSHPDGASPIAVPRDTATEIIRLTFAVRRGAPLGFSAVRFTDVGPVQVLNQPVFLSNAVAVEVDDVPDNVAVPIAEAGLGGGGVEIIGEVGFFLRGDADMSCVREITDPLVVLGYLFLGAAEPPCLDAADADDSGRLDLSDAVFTLRWLFNGGANYSEPFQRPMEDPTDDRLDCAFGFAGETACDVRAMR